MSRYSRTLLPDHVLLRQSRANAARECGVTAELLADVAEIDARRLYVPDGCSSMFAWCMRELHLSEDAAYKRIQAARAARRHAVLFDAIADGRLHLSAVVLLAPHLTEQNAGDLVAAATHKSKADVEKLLAERFPRPDLPPLVRVSAPATPAVAQSELLAGDAGAARQAPAPGDSATQLVPEPVGSLDSQRFTARTEAAPPQRTKPVPLSPKRYGLQFTIDQAAYDDLIAVQALLGRAVAPGDIAAVFAQAIQLLRRDLERRRCAATKRSRRVTRRGSSGPRDIPAAVRREVWRRDGKRCTFVSDKSHQCEERANLELDHVTPVARGGKATVANLRLRCRTHNQYEAERVFGKAFMDGKREAGRARKDEALRRKSAGACEARSS